jgi:hypothetical protein
MPTTTRPATQPVHATAQLAPDRSFGRSLGEVVANYRILGWKVSVTEQGVMLPLGPTTTALVMPARIGSAVLAELRARMLAGPTLVIPSPQENWLFLAELVALLPAPLRSPSEIRFVRSPNNVVLPPTMTPYGRVRWANAPSFNRHWLPPFTAVLAVARQIASKAR